MMTSESIMQFNKYRSFMISLGYTLAANFTAQNSNKEICWNGKVWEATHLSKKTKTRNADLGRLLRSSN